MLQKKLQNRSVVTVSVMVGQDVKTDTVYSLLLYIQWSPLPLHLDHFSQFKGMRNLSKPGVHYFLNHTSIPVCFS